ncbi:hypothetical protein [Rhizobium sp. LjRoot254]|uniref:hypothetical protein n=1 Tax=Rhizobium sp. LjRoot254 TaxID=3342297 RepID=UPI003ECF5980
MRSVFVSIRILRANYMPFEKIAEAVGITRDQLNHYRRDGVICPPEIRAKLDALATETIGKPELPRRHAWTARPSAAR